LNFIICFFCTVFLQEKTKNKQVFSSFSINKTHSYPPWSLQICEGNLALLREKIGHDPESYGSEWAEHLVHFQAQMRLLQVQPQQQRWQLESLLSLTEFLGSTAQRFPGA
jgi:hypothetical protein